MAHARTTDPITSHEAAASVKELSSKQRAVLNVMRLAPLRGKATDVEIGNIYLQMHARFPTIYPMQSPSGLRTRRSELVACGYVEDSGVRVVLPTSRRAIVWRVTKKVSA